MSYGEYEESPDLGSPITLYEFTTGPAAADVFRWTDADEDVAHEGEVWERIAIKRGPISNTSGKKQSDFSIFLPADNPVSDLFILYPPSQVVGVRVLEGHFSDVDRQFLTIFTGRLLNSELAGMQATLSCESAATSLKRLGLRRHYQKQCPLMLYDTGPGNCNAVKEPIICTVLSAGESEIFLTEPVGGLPRGAEAYPTGIVTWVNTESGRTEIRSILTCVAAAGVVRITTAGASDFVGGSVTLLRGCSHTERACTLWHDNIVNYGGQLWIPLKNPINSPATYL